MGGIAEPDYFDTKAKKSRLASIRPVFENIDKVSEKGRIAGCTYFVLKTKDAGSNPVQKFSSGRLNGKILNFDIENYQQFIQMMQW